MATSSSQRTLGHIIFCTKLLWRIRQCRSDDERRWDFTMFLPNPKASGEKSKIPVRRDEYGPSCNTTSQAKEEGRQDGLIGRKIDMICLTSSLHSYPFHHFLTSFFLLFVGYHLSAYRRDRLVGLNACINGWWSILAGLSMIVLRYYRDHGIWDTGLESGFGKWGERTPKKTHGLRWIISLASILSVHVHLTSIPGSYPYSLYPFTPRTDSLSSSHSLSSTNTSCLNFHACLALTLLYSSRTPHPHVYTFVQR